MAASNHSGAGLRVSLVVEIPSDVTYIERVVELVRHPCAELSYTARQLALNVPVALSEAISNAILRANHEDPAKRVLITVAVDARCLVVDIQDEGDRFDMATSTRDATSLENLEREDGRGLFLMRKLMDHVERFDSTSGNGAGNIVRLTLSRA